MSRNGPFALMFHCLFVLFILAPMVLVCLVAFTPEGYLSIPVTEFSLRWFHALANYPEFFDSFLTSLWLAAISSTIAVSVATLAALGIARHRFAGRDALTTLFLSPLIIPHIVLGIAFLRYFSAIGITGTTAGLIISHTVVIFPFALRLVLANAIGFDMRIEHAALSLGAGRFTVFTRITLPLLIPGIFAGWTLSVIQSFDEVTMTVFVASPTTTTLPIRMFNYIQDNIDPLICAVSALLMLFTAVVMFIIDRVYGLERLFTGERP